MNDTRIYATIEDEHGDLIISGSLRLLREYQPDLERCVLALLRLLERRVTTEPGAPEETPVGKDEFPAGVAEVRGGSSATTPEIW